MLETVVTHLENLEKSGEIVAVWRVVVNTPLTHFRH